MSEIKRLRVGTRMADIVIHEKTVYLSGKVPRDPEAGIAEQTKDVLQTIEGLLGEAGTGKEKILKAEIYLATMDDFQAMNTVWEQWVVPGSTPARATVEARLANPKYRVEIVVTAAL